jgi:hypothetical protein
MLPDSVTLALERGMLSALRTGRLYPQEYPDTHLNTLRTTDAILRHLRYNCEIWMNAKLPFNTRLVFTRLITQ